MLARATACASAQTGPLAGPDAGGVGNAVSRAVPSIAMAGPTRSAAGRLAPLIVAAAGVAILILVARSFIGSSGFAYDFEAYHSAARRLVDGLPLYPPGAAEAYNSGAYQGLYLYAPPLAIAMMPIAQVDLQAAAVAWLWLRVAVLIAAIAILPISRGARAGTIAVAALTFPVWYDLNLGNVSVVLFALSAIVWRYRTSPVAAVALAFAGVVRYPFAIVGLALVLARRFRQVASTIVAGLLICAATLAVVGVSGWLDYVRFVGALRDLSGGEQHLSLANTAAALGLPGPSGAWVGLGIAIALAATWMAARRRDFEIAVVVSLTATLLFAPFFHPHYLVQLLVPAAYLAGRGQWWGLALPLLGWLPGEVQPLAAVLGIVAPLLPPEFLATARGDGLSESRSGAGTGSGRDPRPPEAQDPAAVASAIPAGPPSGWARSPSGT